MRMELLDQLAQFLIPNLIIFNILGGVNPPLSVYLHHDTEIPLILQIKNKTN